MLVRHAEDCPTCRHGPRLQGLTPGRLEQGESLRATVGPRAESDRPTNHSIHAVIFDLYGTLVDFSARRLDQALADIAEILRVPHAAYVAANSALRTAFEDGVFETLESHFHQVCAHLGATAMPEYIEAAAARCLAFGRMGLKPRSDAAETLNELRARGFRIGLISNCSPEVPAVWAESPLAALVDVAVFSCRERVRKPNPEIYQLTCTRLGVEPGACLYVGDGGSRELSGATAVGMLAVAIRAPHEDPFDIERLGRESWTGPTITSLSEVLSMLTASREVRQ